VACPSLFANWIEDLYNRGITAGCGGGNYCPNDSTTRAQMAVFVTANWDLPRCQTTLAATK
jgi:S-layer homology domain